MQLFTLLRSAACGSLVFAGAAMAQSAPVAVTALAPTPAPVPVATPAPVDDTLYQALGGQPGLVSLVDETMARFLSDERTRPFFKDIDAVEFKSQLVTQLCELSGGLCKRKGKDMKAVHSGNDINKAAFNAVVEILQQSMEVKGIGFGTQNRLLAKLAPMHRDIVNVP